MNLHTDTRSGLEMIRIPAGEFIYGQGDSRVTLPAFWISKTPVTNAHYFLFVREMAYDSPSHWPGAAPPKEIANHPVVYINSHDVKAYADWAGMDLPTEQEWEKAARGTDGRIYPWGSEWVKEYCNTLESNIGTTTPVGQYSPQGDSPYGCVDMAGNVYEWTASWYDDEKKRYAVRGSSWSTYRLRARLTDRISDHPDYCSKWIGFRVVSRLDPPS